MERQVSVGEWMNSLMSRMESAVDGDCFCLPTPMHLHAFQLVKDSNFPHRDFKVKVRGVV